MAESAAETASNLQDHHGGAAYIALKKHITKLSETLAPESIATDLYQEDLITERTLDQILRRTNPDHRGSGQSTELAGTQLVREVQDIVRGQPHLFNSFCQILKRKGHNEISKSLQGW
jgi:uncharacterized membrane-anchored protein YhcB (DUF1043 family)